MSFITEELREITPDDMRRIGVGERFWDVTLDQIPDTAAYKHKLKTYVDRVTECVREGVGLLLFGDLRMGKTSAAVIVAKAVVAHGGTAYMIRADEIQNAVMDKESFDEDPTVSERLTEVDLLIIDDLGQEHSKDFGRALLENVVRQRYDNKMPLIVTTNVPANLLEEKYGQAVFKVMRSMMLAVPVDGTSWFDKEVEKVKGFLEDGSGEV